MHSRYLKYRKHNISFSKYMSAALCTVCTVGLCGCAKSGTEEEIKLADFSASMSKFSDYINSADEKLNNLDSSSPESVTQMLEILDDMNAEFEKFANIEVPDQYEGIESLADEASQHMNDAVNAFHSVYEAEEFNEYEAAVALQRYTWAMTRIEYIGYILSGDEIPANDHVTVYEETNDAHILDKWLSDDNDSEDSSTSAPVGTE